MFFEVVSILLVLLLTLFLVLKYFLLSKAKHISFEDKHVFITGGSSGIGKAVAQKVFEKGARVTLVARQQNKLQDAQQWLLKRCPTQSEDRLQCISLDITASYTNVQQAVQLAERRFGVVDVLVNSAGYSYPCVFDDLTMEDFERMMRVNYMGAVQVTKAVVKGMIAKYSRRNKGDSGMGEGEIEESGVTEGSKRENEREEGRVVFVSSQAGQMGLYGFSSYSASKFALRGLAESLHMELLRHSIRVSVAYPPDTDTPGFEEEMRTKPLETKLISESSGLFEADVVADAIVDGVKRGLFSISVGVEGSFMSHLTAGMTPASSATDALLQVLFSGFLRLMALFYARKFESIVSNGAADETSPAEENKDK